MKFPCVRLARILLLLAITLPFAVHAHNSSKGITALKMELQPDNAKAQFTISFFDTEILVKIDQNSNSEITAEELTAALKTLGESVSRDMEFYFDGRRVMPTEVKPRMSESYLEVELLFTNITTQKIKVRSNMIRRLTPEHQEMVSILDEQEKEIFVRTLTPANNEFELIRTNSMTVASAAPENATLTMLGTTIRKGMYHIFTGYDHLLFLFALLVMCESFGSVVKIITCFTIAHSLTLGLAGLGIVPVNSRVIEPMIAATIVYVGIENLLHLKTIQWRWVITFLFGLIHGFGFASGLKELGISSKNILLPVLSFNLGVELGQVCIAVLILPILWRLKKMPNFTPRWVPACSLVVVALGSYWFIQRVWP